MAERQGAPEGLGDEDGPEPADQQGARIVAGGEQKLVARDVADGVGMPAAEGGAAAMPGDGAGYVLAGEREAGAAQAEVDIFEVRFEAFFEQADAGEEVGAEERGGPGGGPDGARGVERRAIVATVADAPGGGAAADGVEGGVDGGAGAAALRMRAGGEPGAGVGERLRSNPAPVPRRC